MSALATIAIIVIVGLVLPAVIIASSSIVGSAILTTLLKQEVDARHEGSELLDLH